MICARLLHCTVVHMLLCCIFENVVFTLVFNCFQGLSAISLLVGAYYAFKDRKDNNKDNYYFAKGSMSPVS